MLLLSSVSFGILYSRENIQSSNVLHGHSYFQKVNHKGTKRKTAYANNDDGTELFNGLNNNDNGNMNDNDNGATVVFGRLECIMAYNSNTK